MLSHQASDRKLNEQEEQERRDRDELARKDDELKNELKAAKERIVRVEGGELGHEKSQVTMCRTAKKDVVVLQGKPEVEWQSVRESPGP